MTDRNAAFTDKSEGAKPKKKFLTRGTGTAGGRKGYDKSKSRQ